MMTKAPPPARGNRLAVYTAIEACAGITAQDIYTLAKDDIKTKTVGGKRAAIRNALQQGLRSGYYVYHQEGKVKHYHVAPLDHFTKRRDAIGANKVRGKGSLRKKQERQLELPFDLPRAVDDGGVGELTLRPVGTKLRPPVSSVAKVVLGFVLGAVLGVAATAVLGGYTNG